MRAPNLCRQSGAVLLGVVVLAAILLIGAATIGVIYLRQLDQQRKVENQMALERAFHGIFPGFRTKGANMFADFAYSPVSPGAPPANFYDLKGLTTRTSVTGVTTPAAFTGAVSTTIPYINGWNGPYWTGSVDGQNRPVDSWGRPLQLRYISTTTPPGWQVFSLGANGSNETGDSGSPSGDDQVFPVPPYVLPVSGGTCPTPSVAISRTSGFSPAENITVTLSWSGGTPQSQGPITVNNGNGGANFTFSNLPTGVTITVHVTSSKSGHPFFRSFSDQTFVLDSNCSPFTFTI